MTLAEGNDFERTLQKLFYKFIVTLEVNDHSHMQVQQIGQAIFVFAEKNRVNLDEVLGDESQ